MGASEIVAILAFLLGSGFLANQWRRRLRVRIELRHQAMNGVYEVIAIISNAGERDEHLTEVRITAVDRLTGTWTNPEIEYDADQMLPARGKPARHTITLPDAWIDQRARFRVEAKLPSRKRPVRSKVQDIQTGVLNALSIP